MAERIEATASCASASARSALAWAASAESDAWASAWLTACATTSLTVETNVALTWRSTVFAAVSVTFGAIGLAFSLTKYSKEGRRAPPSAISSASRSLKSAGMTIAA